MGTPTFTMHKCDACTMIVSTQDIPIPKEIFKKVGRKPIFIGTFTIIGWAAHSYFFVFKCSACGSVVIDSPRGYNKDGLFLQHGDCPKGAVEINGTKITRWPLDERNLKELEKRIREEKAYALEAKTLDFVKLAPYFFCGLALLVFVINFA